MGIPRPKNLERLAKLEADLKVRCNRCGRSAVFALVPVLNHFRMMGWNTAWEAAQGHFRCRGAGDDRGCGSKDITLSWVPKDRPPAPEPRLTNRDIKERIRRERG